MNTELTTLVETARRLAEEARTNPSLAERLLADPAVVISDAAGTKIPDGISVSTQRNDDGSIAVSARIDPAAANELDDSLLERVAGGNTNSMAVLFKLS